MILLTLLLGWFLLCVTLLLWPGRTSQRYYVASLEDKAESGGDWSGVREPRRPRRPFWPSRAAVAIPEETEVQMPGSSSTYSTIPQQPLRLEDGLA